MTSFFLSIPFSPTTHMHPKFLNEYPVSSVYSFRKVTSMFFRSSILAIPVCSIPLSTQRTDVPLLSSSEIFERMKKNRESFQGKEQFRAMYSSIFGGITTNPFAMVIPLDDHMVHRGHGVFDTATIMNGCLYELDKHLDRFLRSASMAKISPPFERETIRSILIQTVSASKCKEGSLRYFLSSGHGDFELSPSACNSSSLYAVAIQHHFPWDRKTVKVITSSIPMKPPLFATIKSVNYLPNVLSKMEAEEKGAFAGIWVDGNGFVAEGPNMNVGFVTKDGELVMPVFDNILSGCTAGRILSLAERLVGKGEICGVKVRDVRAEEGKRCGEMILMHSGPVPLHSVVQWDEQIIGDGNEGRVAGALLNLLMEDMKSGPSAVRVPVPY